MTDIKEAQESDCNCEPRLGMAGKIARAYGIPFATLIACWGDK